MKSFLSLMFFLLSVCLYSQVCEKHILKYDVDPIKKSKTVETKSTLLRYGVGVYFSMKFYMYDKKIYFRILALEEKDFVLQSEIGFLFEGDSSILVKFANRNSSTFLTNFDTYGYQNDLELTVAQYMMFTQNKLISIKFYGTGRKVEISAGNAMDVIEKAKCFAQNIDFTKDILYNAPAETIQIIDSIGVIENKVFSCNYTQNEVDEIEGWKRLRLNKQLIGWSTDPKVEMYQGYELKTEARGQLVVDLRAVDSTVFLNVHLAFYQSYCINDKSELAIKFADGEIIRIANIGGIDCGENAEFDSRLSKSQIASLRTKEVMFVRLYCSDGYVDIKSITEPRYFINALPCVLLSKK